MSSVIENNEIIITNPMSLKEVGRLKCTEPSEISSIIESFLTSIHLL